MNKIVSYLFSLFLFVFSIVEVSFYVLCRDEVVLLSCFKLCSRGGQVRDKAASDENASNLEHNWYFEPKTNGTIENSPVGEHKATAEVEQQDETNKEEEQRLMIRMNEDDTIYEKYQFREKCIVAAAVVESDNEEDLHKESMSDVIFSAKKSPQMSTTAKVVAQQDTTPCISSSSSSSSTSPMLSSENISHSNNLISELKLETEDSKTDTNIATHSICPTLAVQEDISDYISIATTPHCLSKNSFLDPPPQQPVKKLTHTRTPSLLSGSAAQAKQLMTGGLLPTEANTTTPPSNGQTKKLNQTQTKRPLYVYVDYTYEEQLMQKIQPEICSKQESRIRYLAEGGQKNADTSVANTCLSNTGTVIDAFVPDLISNSILINPKSSLSNTTQSLNSSSLASTNPKAKPRSKSSNGMDSRTSSLISSSNDSNHHLAEDVMGHYFGENSLTNSSSNNNYPTTSKQLASTAKIYVALGSKPNSFVYKPGANRSKDFEMKHETSV